MWDLSIVERRAQNLYGTEIDPPRHPQRTDTTGTTGTKQDATAHESDIDYTSLAEEAEAHKSDIIPFLNQSHVQSRYRTLYDKLLAKLNVNNENPWTASTRRIVAGRNTSIGAVPWQASLREKTYPICGGSVVTGSWIVTAAHCLLRARSTDLSVRLGSSWKTHGGEIFDVKESFVHPRYVSKTKINDVGLVRLYSPLRFSAKVMPIPIALRDKRLPANQAAIVSGWGKLKEGGPSATFLQASSIKSIAMKLCRWSGLDRKAINPESMFCAGSFSQDSPDACQGDSGGPIVSEAVLIGVVSWGLGCARGNFPGVYTRLAHPVISEWLYSHIQQTDILNTTTNM